MLRGIRAVNKKKLIECQTFFRVYNQFSSFYSVEDNEVIRFSGELVLEHFISSALYVSQLIAESTAVVFIKY